MAYPHLEGNFSKAGASSPDFELTPSLPDISSDNTMFDFDGFPTLAPDAHTDGHYDGSLDFGAHFEPANTPAPAQASTVQTVSPKDIMVDSMSEPPSGAFTDLTTPGTSSFESPYMANSSETSPLFLEDSFNEDPDQWPSLFGPCEDLSNKTPAPCYASSPTTALVAPKMSRNDSSPGQSSSRSSHQGHHSFTAGVAPRRRDKPLPAITVEDPNDTVAVKRARNTLAARKSREKRVERTEALINQVNHLEEEVEKWKNIALSMGHVE